MGRPPGRDGVGGDGHRSTSCPTAIRSGEYLLLFDPLDGSSNIDVNVSIGTIFSVLRKVGHQHGVDESDFLQAGSEPGGRGLLPCTARRRMLVLTVGDGVAIVHARSRDGFVDADADQNVQIPDDTKEFAINMSNQRHWAPPVTRYIDELPAGQGRDRAARTSTCAGSPRWWPTCTAS